MKPNRLFSHNYIKYSLILLAGLLLGWLFFHTPGGSVPETITAIHEGHEDEATVWTCSMHPNIRMDKPGKCPICGMDLIPLSQSGNVSVDPDAIHFSDEAMALANVQTTVVSKGSKTREVRLYGKVQADERLLQSQVSHIAGRIEKLYVNFTGENVKAGQVLAEIYSPDLVTAQQELLQTAETKKIQPDLYEASKERLRQWKLSDEQIRNIESSGKVLTNFRVLSNTSGTVTSRLVNDGDHVSEGTVLFTVADLSKVWLLFDAYESDLPFLAKGKPVTFTLQSFPGKEFKGDISFIDPVIDPLTRVARVRVEYDNRNGELKPEMFATGIVSASLAGYGNMISVPASAVLWTGKRSIVYVKQTGDTENLFKMREVELGPSLGENYIVVNGLNEGEEIVTNGAFSVDASAQLEGKPSMMNQTGGRVSTGHDHGALQGPAGEMPETDRKEAGASANKISVSMDFTMKLNEVVDHYLELKNALVNSDQAKAAQASAKLKQSLSGVDMKSLKGEPYNKWMDLSSEISKQADVISSRSPIEKQRMAFADLSDQVYNAVKTFGLMGKTVYYQFCPMARDGKGAFWLSELNEIRNPYYGEAMLTCGETRETLKY
ncbi:MAG TPA: efflux RND transporter periplasmic adaptor subunit [Bacteroidales bacterium]|nr:efflux RND transporter periplasmic adaptor subunit [Bacteroidales bacterium]